MSLENLRKRLKDKVDALPAIKEKAIAETATAEDVAALTAASAEIKSINDQIDAIEAADAEAARAAKPVAKRAEPTRSPLRVKLENDVVFSVGAIMAAQAYVKAGHAPDLRTALEDNGYGNVVDIYESHAKKQLTSTGATAGILLPPAMAAEIIEFLRPRTAFLQNSPRRVPLVNGTYYQAAGNTGATASYGRENSLPAYSEATFRDVNLSSKELQGKTAVSNLLLARGVSGIRAFVEEDLRNAMAETMDRNLFLGDGQQMRPLGLYNVPGLATRAGQNSTTPTQAQIDADARWAINSISTANINLATARWTMSMETAGYLEDLITANGVPVYPTMQGENKSFKGYPVSITTNLPTNLGVGSNRSHVSLAAYTHVFFGEEDGLTIRTSSEAMYTDGGGNQRSAFERDETVMIAVARHDVGLRHLRATALLTDINWGR